MTSRYKYLKIIVTGMCDYVDLQQALYIKTSTTEGWRAE